MIGILISVGKLIIVCWLTTTVNPLNSHTATRCKLLCFQWTSPVETLNIPSPKSHIRFSLCRSLQSIRSNSRPCVAFCNGLFLGSRFPLAQPKIWRFTPCRLSANAYSVYSQLLYISGCRVLHLQPEGSLVCRGDRDPHNVTKYFVTNNGNCLWNWLILEASGHMFRASWKSGHLRSVGISTIFHWCLFIRVYRRNWMRNSLSASVTFRWQHRNTLVGHTAFWSVTVVFVINVIWSFIQSNRAIWIITQMLESNSVQILT